MASFDLITLAELKRYVPSVGTAKDTELREAIARASAAVEGYLDRRLVFRAPTESATSIRSSTAWSDGSPAATGQPSAARTLVVSWTAATAGALTVTGTVDGATGQTETFDIVNSLADRVLYGVKFFTAVSGLTIVGATGGGNVTVGTSLGYLGYFNSCGDVYLRPRQRPIRYVGEINEDVSRVFGASTALVQGVDFEVREGRRLARIYAGLDFSWLAGRRVVKGRTSAGYFTVANVPVKLKLVCARRAAWDFSWSEGRNHGLTVVSDASGNRSFSGPPMFTAADEEALAEYIRGDVFDADEEVGYVEDAA